MQQTHLVVRALATLGIASLAACSGSGYVANNGTNDISGYAMNAATCALAPLPGSPFADPGTNPIGVAI
jgi:hypothetical protein